VHYVRFRERYPRNFMLRGWNAVVLVFEALVLFCRLVLHTARHPKFFGEYQFPVEDVDRHGERSHGFRPLFGWPVWLLSVLYPSMFAAPWLRLLGAGIAARQEAVAVHAVDPWFLGLLLFSVGLFLAPLPLWLAVQAWRWAAKKLGKQTDIPAYVSRMAAYVA